MKKLQLKHAIVWTIDPWEKRNQQRQALANFLKKWSQKKTQKILPFSIAAPLGSDSTPVPYLMGKDFYESGTKTVSQNLKKFKMKNLGEPKLEVHSSASKRELVDSVLLYAKEKKAGFIAVNTRGLDFAEALISDSPIPILAVNPKAKVSKSIKKILFPTDFSPRSHEAFRATLEVATAQKARIVLLHVEMPAANSLPIFDSGTGISSALVEEDRVSKLEASKKIGLSWCKEAKKAKVPCELLLRSDSWIVGKSVVSQAKKIGADLISLASHGQPKSFLLFGGPVHDTLSRAKIPVMVIPVPQ